jgi:predicted DNA-binding transcriptional regulator AlpA
MNIQPEDAHTMGDAQGKNTEFQPFERIIPAEQVYRLSTISKHAYRREEEAGRAPRMRRISANKTGLLASEFLAWLNSLKPAPRINIDSPSAEPRRVGRPANSELAGAPPVTFETREGGRTPKSEAAPKKASRPRGRPPKNNQVAA